MNSAVLILIFLVTNGVSLYFGYRKGWLTGFDVAENIYLPLARGLAKDGRITYKTAIALMDERDKCDAEESNANDKS